MKSAFCFLPRVYSYFNLRCRVKASSVRYKTESGMGRLYLILGFRGCGREMGMEALLMVNFADNYSLRSHIPLRSCLVGLRL